jgi:hypothetical protein
MVKYDLPTVFLDFEKMTTDPKYLFDKLKVTFSREFSLSTFTSCYKRASEHQSKRTPLT